MRQKYNIAAVSTAILLTYITRGSALYHENFGLDRNLDREKLMNYLSTVLCSIDIKFANIYFEFESVGKILDDVIAVNSCCIPPSTKMFAFKKEATNFSVSTSSGTRLLILLELELKSQIFPMLFRIRQTESFNLFYMIVTEKKLSSDYENLLKEMYWNYNLLNAVVVAAEDDNSDVSVITYNPFKNETIRIPNNAHKKEELFFTKNSNIFGYPINIVMYRDSVTTLTEGAKKINYNYEIFLPDLISSAMNATLILTTPLTKDLKIEEMLSADLSLNGRIYAVDLITERRIEETVMLRRHDMCILLPYNRIRNTFKMIAKTVDSFVWMSMIVVTFQVWISLLIIRRTRRRAERHKSWNHVFLFDLFGLHVNQALTHIPENSAPRLVIVSCLMYCLVIKSVFEGLLYTNIARNQDTRISTVEQLLEMNQHEILVNNIVYNYSEHFLKHSPIQNRFKVIHYLEFVKRLDSSDVHYAFVGGKRGAIFYENTRIVEGLPVFYVMDECIVPFMARYFVRGGSPFLNRINFLLRLAEESGLFGYWENELSISYNKLKQSQQLFVHQTPIDLELLALVFQIWSYGLAIATVTFIIERYASTFKIRTEIGQYRNADISPVS
ncbi:hypothetical protein HA402_008636 [Bradysia odoriphaga]|nr:hypothetical protein HA402_008636 [Bradysia odoriphaga]